MTAVRCRLGALLCVGWLALAGGPLVGAEAVAPDPDAGSHHHNHGGSPSSAGVAGQLPVSGMDPEEDLAYSLFMHHAAGAGVLLVGGLLLADRFTAHRYRAFRAGIGAVWVGMGLFLFTFSDLEAWPIGPAGFLDSFSLPTAHEWIQHHVLSLIPVALGVATLVSPRREGSPVWKYLAAGLGVLGGAGLLIHQHLDHPGMDIVNLQHRFFALTSFFIAASLAVEAHPWIAWRAKPYLLPAGLLLLGAQLAFYVE